MADEPIQLAPDEPAEGAPEWMVTFGDLMSLLMTFFVLLLSFSQMDVAKFKELAGSLENAFGVQRQEPLYNRPIGTKMIARDFDQTLIEQAKVGHNEIETAIQVLAEQLHNVVQPLEEQGLVEIDLQDQQLTLRLLGHATFDSGRADLKPEMVPTLLAIGKLIGNTKQEVFVAGHTDNVPIRSHRYRSNLELSAARAASVVDLFVRKKLLAPELAGTMGYGEYRPLKPNDSKENRQKNRRVEIILAFSRQHPVDTAPFPLSVPFLLSPGG